MRKDLAAGDVHQVWILQLCSALGEWGFKHPVLIQSPTIGIMVCCVLYSDEEHREEKRYDGEVL